MIQLGLPRPPFSFVLALVAVIALSSLPSTSAESPVTSFQDDFRQNQNPARKELRGDWKIAGGVASVTQDDELYKKFKNHGPILNYEIIHTDADVTVEFKGSNFSAIVFTMDAVDGGHAFRVILRPDGKPGICTIQTYTEKEDGGKAKPIVLDRSLASIAENEWMSLSVRVEGEQATVTLGDQTVKVQHERIAQAKNVAKLGFSFGELSVRKFNVNVNVL
jgi:hypothetical protein